MSTRMRLRLALALIAASMFAGQRRPAENLAIRSYTVTEGLAHDHVSRIYRDSHGLLWICTDEGLSRFDGLRFVNYTVADGLPHIHVNDIVEARSGDYWIATDGGLTLFRPADHARRFTTMKPDGPPEALFINAVVEQPDGSVMLGTGAGLYQLDRGNGASNRIEFPGPPDNRDFISVNSLYVEADGTLWAGSSLGLCRRSPTGQWQRLAQPEGLPHDFIERIVPDPAGRIWVCTRHGLARLRPRVVAGAQAVDLTVTVADGLPADDVRAILFAPDGRRWIGTHGGLVEWAAGPPARPNFRVYSAKDGLTNNQVNAVATDVKGNLWVGTRRGGVMRIVRTGFQSFGSSEGLVTSGTDRIVESPSGGICIAGIEDPRRALRCFDGERFHPTFPRLPPAATREPPGPSHAAIFDHQGEWWISTAGGVFRFRGGQALRQDVSVPDISLPQAGESRVLLNDSHDDIWITTMVRPYFGLMRWQRANARLQDLSSSLPDGIRRQGATALAEAPPGTLWLGLARPGGLFRFRNGRFEQVEGVPAGTVQALHRDRSGHLWIASAEGGVGRIDDPSADHVVVRAYQRSSGFASNEVWCLAEDRAGRIYAGSVRGVDRIDPAATDSIRHYSSGDGLIPGDIQSAFADRNGDLWFLSNRGLSRFHPVQDPPQTPLDARITAIHVAGEPYGVSELGQKEVPSADFRWNRNSVQIEFSALAFQSPEPPRYQFRLLGTPEDWSEPSVDSSVHFSHLAPGRYRFVVHALNTSATAGPPASFAFTIGSPPWLRWWFQAGLAGLIVSVAYASHKFRLERRLALERIRSRIATDLHDDIGANLSRIAAMSEAVKSRVAGSDADSHRMLSAVAETSRETIGAMSDIVWSIDPRRDDLGDVVARLRAFGSDVLEPLGIRWVCEGPAGALDNRLAPDQRRQFYLICKEAIHNIARHSHARNVTLRIALEGSFVTCEIEDDGRGVPNGGGAGLGIGSMQGRAASLGGYFRISPREEGGTRATLHFPLHSRNA